MKKTTQKNNKILIVAGAVLSFLIGGGIGATITHLINQKPAEPEVVEPGGINEPSIVTTGMNLKLISSTNNADGSVTKNYSYSMNPANAEIQSATATIKYSDGTACPDSVMTASVDKTAKTVAITNKTAFNKKIAVTVKLTATDGSTASGTITFDYVKKLLSLSSNIAEGDHEVYYLAGAGYSTSSAGYLSSFAATEFMTPNYSIYTKNKNYTFAVEHIEALPSLLFGSETFKTMLSPYTNQLETFFTEKIRSGAAVTAADLYNLSSDSDYHTALRRLSNLTPSLINDYIELELYLTIYCVEEPDIKISIGGGDSFIKFGINYDFTRF